MSIFEVTLTYYLYLERKRMVLMKFIVVVTIVSAIANIVLYIIQRRELILIKNKFKNVSRIYRLYKDRED